MVSQTIAITNPLGLHARAAAKFVKVAGGFASQIKVGRGTRVMDGKSILGLLLLGAARGSEITVTAEGPDEVEAVDALVALAARGFEDA